MPDIRIFVSGEMQPQISQSAKLELDTQQQLRAFIVGFSNSDLILGPLSIRHKSVKELMHTIAGIKQSLDQVGQAAMNLVKQNA